MSWWSNISTNGNKKAVQWRDECFPEKITDVLETFDGKDDYVNEFKFTDDEISDTSDSEK